MILHRGRTYELKTIGIDCKVSYYKMVVTAIYGLDHEIIFYIENTSKSFSLTYDIMTINNCIEEGSWVIKEIKPDNILDEELFIL